MTTFLYVLAAILMLGVMVTVHEWGHFIAARITGIPVKEFAIGFGKAVCSWKSKKHETRFFLRLIPAGGYCMFYGEDDVNEKEKDDPRNLNRHRVWKRLLTVLMGPMMNFALALVVAVSLFAATGVPEISYGYTVVDAVNEGSPAQEAGIMPEDTILRVNGTEAKGITEGNDSMASALISAYQEGDAPLTLTLLRGDETVDVQVAPRFDEEEGRQLIGVMLQMEYTLSYKPVGFFRACALGADYCVRAGGAILEGLGKLVTTGEGIEDSAGPIGIVRLIAEETQKNGFLVYLELLVLISVNLGLFNLIPIPGLDGSRAIFLLIEGIFRKPVPRKVEATVHLVGYGFLMVLMLVMTSRDIFQIFR